MKKLEITITYSELKRLCKESFHIGKNDGWNIDFESWWVEQSKKLIKKELRKP
jgi:hypothetical protein